jgi:hypothetical protein
MISPRLAALLLALPLSLTGPWALQAAAPPAGEPSLPAAGSPFKALPLKQRFAPPNFGYSLLYPEDWQALEPAPFSVVIGGPPGTPAFHTTVSIQNVRIKDKLDPQEAAAKELNALEARLIDGTIEASVAAKRPFLYVRGGLKLGGYQMVTAFVRKGDSFKQWTIILPRPKGNILHVWTFTAPEDEFDASLPTARAILDSWTIEADGK